MTTEQSLPWHYERRIEDSKWGDGIPREIDYFTRDDGVQISGNETPGPSWKITHRRQDIEIQFHVCASIIPSGIHFSDEKEYWRYTRGLGPKCLVAPNLRRIHRPLTDGDAEIIASDIRDFLFHFHEFGIQTQTPLRPVQKLDFGKTLFWRFSDT